MAGNSQKTFNLLPIQYDEDGKLVKIIGGYSDPLLTKEVESVNKLASDIDEYGFDVPPLPLLPGKSGRIEMTEGPCEVGNEACQQSKYPEAIGLYTKAIEEVQARPQWENAGMLLDRLQLLFKARSQACLLNKDWPEAVVDANLSIRFNANENAEAYKIKAHCLREMGRLDEARDTLLDASKIGYHHASEPSFMEMLKEMEKLIDERSEKDAI